MGNNKAKGGLPLRPDKLTCPMCGGPLDFIKDSRAGEEHGFKVVHRRRECGSCGKRSTTIEMTEADMTALVKEFEKARKERAAALRAELAALEGEE